MNVHPAAEVFPLMSEDEYQGLADSIERHGLLEPITLLDGLILDGRHRQRACEEKGIPPRYIDWNPDCGLGPLAWVIEVNLHRRHLTTSQRAAIAVEALPRLEAEANERMRRGVPSDPGANLPEGRARDQAAGLFGVSGRIVHEAKAVRAQAPDEFERVKAGEKTVHAASRALGRRSGGHPVRPRTKYADVLTPLHRWLKDWDETRLRGTTPAQARKLLAMTSETRDQLFEIERALSERAVVSRALR